MMLSFLYFIRPYLGGILIFCEFFTKQICNNIRDVCYKNYIIQNIFRIQIQRYNLCSTYILLVKLIIKVGWRDYESACIISASHRELASKERQSSHWSDVQMIKEHDLEIISTITKVAGVELLCVVGVFTSHYIMLPPTVSKYTSCLEFPEETPIACIVAWTIRSHDKHNTGKGRFGPDHHNSRILPDDVSYNIMNNRCPEMHHFKELLDCHFH
jgi:hypothetical protein